MILNIRGCNGSGKSTLALSLLDADAEIVATDAGLLTVGREVALVGPYPSHRVGGCDRLKTFEEARALIRAAHALYRHVVFEGVIISTVFGSWAEFCKELPFAWVFLDTPLVQCLESVRARNGGEDFNEKLVRDKWETMHRVKARAKAAGFQVYTMERYDATNQCRSLLRLDTRARRNPAQEIRRCASAVDRGPLPGQISFL